MRSGFSIMLIVAILFGGGYWYYVVEAVCDAPIAYRVGAIDPKFNITHEEVKAALAVAESIWEDATGRNLFTYDETAEFSVNFVYDERQEYANAEEAVREKLETKEWMSDSVRKQYDELLDEYDFLKRSYELRTASYERRLASHNAEVEYWNKAGGAPEDIYDDLSVRQQALSVEQGELNTVAYQLNLLVKNMNQIGAEGNTLITDYNQIVEEYNTKFNNDKEFTQGDYQGDLINIYQFDSINELEIVLAHEFGHALSLDHVEMEESIMYHFMGAQDLDNGVTTEDASEFQRVCGTSSFTLWSIL